jgi:hypothetical protein
MSVPLISVLQLSDTHIGSKKNGLNAEINLQRAIKHALSTQIPMGCVSFDRRFS